MYLGVDVGGTKTLVAVFDDSGTITEEVKFPTPHSYSVFVKELASTVAKFTTKEFKTAAVALPGRIDRQKGVGIVFGNLPWKNVPVKDDCRLLFNCPVMVENDANLAGLSEAHLLKNQYKKVFYITISTGIGGGYIVNGVLDPDTLDAEIGATLVEKDGKISSWEELTSGKAIVARYGKRASEIDDPKIWNNIAHDISIGIYNVVRTYTPDAIVIGGGVGAHLDKFLKPLEAELHSYKPNLTFPKIMEAQRPEEAVIYGCYELARAK